MDQCCTMAGDREPVQPCEKIQPTKKPRTRVSNVSRPTGLLLDQTACIHSWRTQACAGGYYLNVKTQKPQACPPGKLYTTGCFCIYHSCQSRLQKFLKIMGQSNWHDCMNVTIRCSNPYLF